eukprot:767186-Hanusia_phi.AAC.6
MRRQSVADNDSKTSKTGREDQGGCEKDQGGCEKDQVARLLHSPSGSSVKRSLLYRGKSEKPPPSPRPPPRRNKLLVTNPVSWESEKRRDRTACPSPVMQSSEHTIISLRNFLLGAIPRLLLVSPSSLAIIATSTARISIFMAQQYHPAPRIFTPTLKRKCSTPIPPIFPQQIVENEVPEFPLQSRSNVLLKSSVKHVIKFVLADSVLCTCKRRKEFPGQASSLSSPLFIRPLRMRV